MGWQSIINFLAQHWVELIAAILGLLSVWLTVRQNIWCWPTGLASVALHIIIFYQTKLYSDVILQVVFEALQIYGWYHWLYGAEDKPTLPVTKSRSFELLGWLAVGLLGTLIWGYPMNRYTDAAAPYPDAFIAVASLIAQWLQARKRLDSWYFWIAADVVAIPVYIYKELIPTAILYLVFLILCVVGFGQWKKSMQITTIGVTATA